MEQFKRSEPQYVEPHFHDLEVEDHRKAVMIADSYELTRCELPWRGRLGKQENSVTAIPSGLPVQLQDGPKKILVPSILPLT